MAQTSRRFLFKPKPGPLRGGSEHTADHPFHGDLTPQGRIIRAINYSHSPPVNLFPQFKATHPLFERHFGRGHHFPFAPLAGCGLNSPLTRQKQSQFSCQIRVVGQTIRQIRAFPVPSSPLALAQKDHQVPCKKSRDPLKLDHIV